MRADAISPQAASLLFDNCIRGVCGILIRRQMNKIKHKTAKLVEGLNCVLYNTMEADNLV